MEPGDMAHFVEIVILGRHPENWYGIDAGLGEFVGDLDCAQRFVERVRGSAEQADLLPAQDRDGAVRKPIDIFGCCFATAKRRVRLAQNCRDFLAAAFRVIERFRGLLDGFERRRMRVELRDAGEIVKEPKKELRLVGQALERYRDTAHRSLDVPCRDWSHC